jgi:very-short-patch-repair endonuclease
MVTEAAAHSVLSSRRTVWTRGELIAVGVSRDRIRAHCAARRWQLCGRAVVLHNGALTRRQRWRVAQLNCGARALLTAFTAAEAHGLRDWERDAVHVLVPKSAPAPRLADIEIRLHRRRHWLELPGLLQPLPAALLIAASTFGSARPACGLLAAGVQQRLVTVAALSAALAQAPKLRHRRALIAAVADIGQGAQALSEIDFHTLCRRNRLPAPDRQTVRRDRSGRRRFLDATWRRPDGRLVVAEVDGALHLAVRRWWDDQLRQNELSLADALVLRFPSVVVRTEPGQVVQQLRRALQIR